MSHEGAKEILQALYRVEDKLDDIIGILRLERGEAIEAARVRVLAGSTLRKRIYELCDGSRSVSEVAVALGKPVQQISNNVTILRDSGLVKEVRSGKQKYYVRVK
jgi:DNA-binding transcriptional ArsR family regulator